jgi:putative sigma-54 modulation protein
MSLQIKSRHCEIDEALKGYIAKKVTRLNRFFAKVQSVEITFTCEKFRYTCVIEVAAPPLSVYASVEDTDPRVAFDKADKVVIRQVKRQKGRMITTKRQGRPERPSALETPVVEDEEFEDDEA